MAVVYAGLDMGSRSFHLVAMNKEGTVVFDRGFTTSEKNLIAAVEAVGGELDVHLEAGELAPWVRRVLRNRVGRVVIGDPKASAWIAKDPRKRDRLDARKLADLVRMGRVHEVYYPEDERLVFKQIVQHYDDLTDQNKRLKLKTKAAFREQGVIARGKRVYALQGREHFLSQVPFPAAREAIRQLYRVLDSTTVCRRQALQLLRRQSERYEEIARFQEVPGVGMVGACRFSAYIATPYRFSCKRKLWRFCRLGIIDRTSDGKPLGRQALDWNGNGKLKDLSRKAFLGAMRRRGDNAFKRAYHRTLRATHQATHARLSTQRKILATLRAIWKEGTRYQDDRG